MAILLLKCKDEKSNGEWQNLFEEAIFQEI